MIDREEMRTGKLEFDIIVNDKCIKRVSGGLLAYYDESEGGMAVVTQGVRPDFIAHVVMCLTAWLIEHKHGDLLVEIMEKSMKKPK